MRHYGTNCMLTIPRTDEEALRTYVRWLSDSDTNVWLGRSGMSMTYEGERQWAQGLGDDPTRHYYNIVDVRRGLVVGNCHVEVHGTNAMLGIVIGDPLSREHGLGTEVIGMLARFAFDELGVHRIFLGVMAENERAIRCYRKVGFVECGHRHEACWYHGGWHDMLDMEILRGDWERRDRSPRHHA